MLSGGPNLHLGAVCLDKRCHHLFPPTQSQYGRPLGAWNVPDGVFYVEPGIVGSGVLRRAAQRLTQRVHAVLRQNLVRQPRG